MEVEYVLKLPQLLFSILLLVTLCQQHQIVIAHSTLERRTNEQTTSNGKHSVLNHFKQIAIFFSGFKSRHGKENWRIISLDARADNSTIMAKKIIY